MSSSRRLIILQVFVTLALAAIQFNAQINALPQSKVSEKFGNKQANFTDAFGMRHSPSTTPTPTTTSSTTTTTTTVRPKLELARPSNINQLGNQQMESSASELQNLMLSLSMPEGKRRFDDITTASASSSFQRSASDDSIKALRKGKSRQSSRLRSQQPLGDDVDMGQKLAAADMLLNSQVGRNFQQELKSNSNRRFDETGMTGFGSQSRAKPKIESSSDDELPGSSSSGEEDETAGGDDDESRQAQSRSSNDDGDEVIKNGSGNDDGDDGFIEPQATISDRFFQDDQENLNTDGSEAPVIGKMNSRGQGKFSQPRSHSANSGRLTNSLQSNIDDEDKDSVDNDSDGDSDSNYDATNISKQLVKAPQGDALSELQATAASQAQMNRAGAVTGSDLAAAAGHHHKKHSHYYQYVEVPKKKAWKFGFKRGNHKHESK